MRGRPKTEETKLKLSEAAKKRLADPRNHPLYGRKLSEETKRRISEARKAYWKARREADEERRLLNE